MLYVNGGLALTLYADWLKEYKNKETLESEHGFIIYSYISENIIYLEDMYIKPESRNQKHSLVLANKLIEIAKQNNVVQLITSLCPTDKCFQRSYDNTIAYGFKISHVHNNLIILKKDVI